jgi:hypothetical protein
MSPRNGSSTPPEERFCLNHPNEQASCTVHVSILPGIDPSELAAAADTGGFVFLCHVCCSHHTRNAGRYDEAEIRAMAPDDPRRRFPVAIRGEEL